MKKLNKQIHIGVDWGRKEGDKTAVVIMRKDEGGTVTVLASLLGEAAEYVAKLEQVVEAAKRAIAIIYDVGYDAIPTAIDLEEAIDRLENADEAE